ncbi:MAG: LD-carboxypeptidase [Anaerovoracaceae bacterium]|nr:LD-carboxypeptidase [Anaerovoracaceae bacterium]
MNKMIWPRPLKKGDKVAITATSSPVGSEKLHASIESVKFLGLEPVVMPSCHLHHGYLAGPDSQRAADINSAFADDDIKGIFCLRGGYGTTRILPMLDFQVIKDNPKVFIGYSDISSLHFNINRKCSLITFHGPMPTTDYRLHEGFTNDSLRNALFDSYRHTQIANPPGEKMRVLRSGSACGMLTGGNLSLMAGTLGSQYEIDTRGKILFIEDVDEKPFRIDKMLTALSLAGKFRDCAGIILGTFERCEENHHPTLSLEEIFQEVVLPWNKPTILNLRAGHIYPQSTLPMGAEVSLDACPDNVDICVLK